MNYACIYNQIIDQSKDRELDGYVEKHHIIPKSLGGSDDPENIVSLTAREHFICHYLLVKLYPENSNEWYKMVNAFMMMKCASLSHSGNRYFNSHLYESLREHFATVQSYNQGGDRNSNYGTKWIHNIELRKSKKILTDQALPDGWKNGRVMDFDAFFEKQKKKKREKERKEEAQEKIKNHTMKTVNEFLNSDYESLNKFCAAEYEYSLVTLCKRMIIYVPGYINISNRGEVNMKEKLRKLLKK